MTTNGSSSLHRKHSLNLPIRNGSSEANSNSTLEPLETISVVENKNGVKTKTVVKKMRHHSLQSDTVTPWGVVLKPIPRFERKESKSQSHEEEELQLQTHELKPLKFSRHSLIHHDFELAPEKMAESEKDEMLEVVKPPKTLTNGSETTPRKEPSKPLVKIPEIVEEKAKPPRKTGVVEQVRKLSLQEVGTPWFAWRTLNDDDHRHQLGACNRLKMRNGWINKVVVWSLSAGLSVSINDVI